ncbi:MAG: hypothetical protein KBS47_06535, partial [Bacteroidales bacterium]|nr:hypothetical protein [Candidatus Equimonas enterica]
MTIGKKSVPVAKIDTTEYTSLADAIAAVPTDGTEPTTITMIANEAIVGNAGVTVVKGQNIVLDLNGKTVSNLVNENNASQIITNYGTLTITDSSNPSTGKMTNAVQDGTAVGEWWSNPKNNYATNVITNRGNLTINGGEIYETAAGSICYPIDNNSSSSAATLTVNGGYIHKDTGTAVRQFCNSTTMDNTVNVNGGTIEGGDAAIWIQLPGGGQAKKAALNVTGGTLKGTYAFYDYTYGDVFDAVQYNLSGGTFDGYIFSYGANMTITGGTYKGEINIKQAKPSHLSVTGGKFSGDIYAYGDNASTGFISGGVYKDYTFEYNQVTYGCYWSYSIDPRYEAIYNTDEATKDEYPYTVGLKEQIIMPEVEEETLEITQDDEQQTEIPEEKQQEVTAAVIAALTQNSSVNNMTAEETNINNAVPVSETQDESERRLKVELTSAVVSAETITEQTTITSTTVKGATFEVKPVYVYEEGGVTKTEIVRNEDITAPITFRLAVQKDIQDDCAKVWHQAVLYDLNGKAYADPDSPKEYLGVFPIQQADNGEKYIQLSASKFSFYNYLTKSMEETTLVAQIGEAKFETLAEAIAAVKDGETIKMIADVTGANGISVESGKNFIIDFDGHTYTFGGDGAGSANTKTCGFQLLKGSNITFKNGTINCDEENKNRTWTTGSTELKGVAMLIQNYADLTLDSMTIDGTNVARNGAATRYVLSNNSGEVHYTGATTITAATGDKAFDACKFDTYPVPTVTIDDAQVTINGNIEAAGGKLVITNGTVNGTISTDTGYTQGDIAISGGSFSEVVASEYCATGFQPVTEKDAQGMYSVEEKNVVLHVYGFENKADKKDMTISEFLTAQQTYPNAMAVTESTNAEDVAELHNVILDYTVGKGGHYYECENFIIDDMADFWYSPVSFYAVAGNYTRKDLTLYNSVCVPFDVTTDNAPSGATFLQYRYSDENKANVYFEIQDYISAGQGFLMQTTAGETWTVTFENTEIRNTIITGAMSGSYETKTIGEGYFKVNSTGDKFTKTTASSNVYPFRSYLDLTGEILGGAPDVSSLSIVIDDQNTTTGINAATSQDIQSVYGLNGVKRNAL